MCHGCQMVTRPIPPEPLKPTPLPDGPWGDLAVDLMGPLPSGHHLLVVVDYYSRYYEVVVVQTNTAGKVIDCLDKVFSRHGLPMSLKSVTVRSSHWRNFTNIASKTTSCIAE